MHKGVFKAVVMLVGLALPLTAQAQDAAALQVYAAFAKLEANVVEAGGALAIVALYGDDLPGREEFVDEYTTDVETVNRYVGFLEGQELGERGTQILQAFTEQWATMSETGDAIVAAEAGTGQEQILEWWEGSEAIDDLVDEEMEALLADNNATIE